MKRQGRAQVVSEAKEILQSYGIRSRFSTRSGQCYSRITEGFVFIGLDSPEFVSRASVLSAVFHEIAHVVNYRNKKFLTYHDDSVLTQKTVDYAKRFGLRAEQHTDYVASKLMKEYDRSISFRFTYTRKKMKERYRSEFLPLLESYLQ